MKGVLIFLTLGVSGWFAWKHFANKAADASASTVPATKATPPAPASPFGTPSNPPPYYPAPYPYQQPYPVGLSYPGAPPPTYYPPQAPYQPPGYPPPYGQYPPQIARPNIIGLSVAAARQLLSSIGLTLRIAGPQQIQDVTPGRVTVGVRGGTVTNIISWNA